MKTRYSLPCVHEGNILEWCHTCNGEKRHVRECDHYDDKCTRALVSHKVRACVTCAKQPNTPYRPDTELTMTDNRNKDQGNTDSTPPEEKSIPQSRLRTEDTPRISVRENRLKERARMLNQRRTNVQRERGLETQGTGEQQEQVRERPKRLVMRKSKEDKPEVLVWEYGITTVEERKGKELDKTIVSLKNGGFDKPRLFVDGTYALTMYKQGYNLDVSVRSTKIKTLGNWLMGMLELYIRNPHAHRYAIFQDDIVCCKNLRTYLDKCDYPDKGYLNLITYPQNEGVKEKYFQGVSSDTPVGWYPSNQMGKGAQGLVFNREALLVLLTHRYLFERLQDLEKGWSSIDGAIVSAMKRSNYTEYVHSPSLLRHVGETSTMGNNPQPPDVSFKGEEWDAMEMLKEGTT